MARYTVIEDRGGSRGDGLTLRGGALQLWRYKGQEAMLAGPAESGKTFACLLKLDALLVKYPGSQAVAVRKQYKTLIPTALQTYQRKVLGSPQPDADGKFPNGVRVFGGSHPQWYDYPNGSRLWVAGFDSPGKALSSDRDFAFTNQSEELGEDDWQTLCTRCTGRAGNAPYGQVFGDCNPGPPHHWIKHRAPLAPGLFESRHRDNPALWDERRRDWTDQGRRTMAVLDALVGVLRDRLRDGKWVAAEGVVYPGFDEAVHVIDPFVIPESWLKLRAIDFGFVHPFACIWLAFDEDGRCYLYRNLHHTRRTVKVHAMTIRGHSPASERYAVTVSDHDSSDRATLHENGVWTVPAVKAKSVGIERVAERLKVQPDGRPRLFIFRDALIEVDQALVAAKQPTWVVPEFAAYSWPKDKTGKPTKKEEPIDRFNDSLDALRYGLSWYDGDRGGTLKPGDMLVPDPADGLMLGDEMPGSGRW
jgi:hypothetical protein